jgi:tetratricopeptide (TPR) repeat protein
MRLVPVIVLLLLAMSAGVHARTPDEIASEGNQAYSEGRFQDAARHYREILKYGIEDPRIEYNMGNAAFKLGHTGEAILHYRRAALLDPLDDEIQANLRFVEATCRDRLEPPEMVAPVRWLVELQGRTGPDRQALAALGLLWLVVIILGWSLSTPGRWRSWHGWTIAGLILAILLVGASLWMTLERLEPGRVAVVLSPKVEILAGPGNNNATLVTVHEGLALEVRSVRGEWVQVRLPEGLNGWVPAELVGIV